MQAVTNLRTYYFFKPMIVESGGDLTKQKNRQQGGIRSSSIILTSWLRNHRFRRNLFWLWHLTGCRLPGGHRARSLAPLFMIFDIFDITDFRRLVFFQIFSSQIQLYGSSYPLIHMGERNKRNAVSTLETKYLSFCIMSLSQAQCLLLLALPRKNPK